MKKETCPGLRKSLTQALKLHTPNRVSTDRARAGLKLPALVATALLIAVMTLFPYTSQRVHAAETSPHIYGVDRGSGPDIGTDPGIGRVKVLVLPFTVHSQRDISGERRELMETLASSLEGAGCEIVGIEATKELMLTQGVTGFDDSSALELSVETGADFALLGSLSALGSRLTANWRIIYTGDKAALPDITTNIGLGKTLAHYHKSSENLEELLHLVEETSPSMHGSMQIVLGTDEVSLGKEADSTGVLTEVRVLGTRRVGSDAVEVKLKSMAGEPLSAKLVREDIHAIYAMGYFEDVTASVSEETEGTGGGVLTFIVREKPVVKKLAFKSNEGLSEEKLRGALTMKTGTMLDRALVRHEAERLKALYSESGYYLAEVLGRVTKKDLDATVTFEINEGPKVTVKRLGFIGNAAFSDKELRGLMETTERGFFSWLTGSGSFSEEVFSNDLARIMNHYFDNGYIRAEILEKTVLLSRDKRWFYVTVAISEGAQFKVGSLRIGGELLADEAELVEKLVIEPGEIFNRSRFSKGLEALRAFYGDKGYAYADLKTQTDLDLGKKTINLTVNITKNEPVYIERIEISGNVKTRDKVIRRELDVAEGDLYSLTGLKKSIDNLRRLGYFDDVSIQESEGSTPGRAKLDVEVIERPTGAFTFGMGYSSVDKVTTTASVSQSNFLGTGLKLNLSANLSSASSRYVLNLTEPWLFDKPISAGIDLYNTTQDYHDFSMDKRGGALRFGFPIRKRHTRMNFTYRYEEVEVSDVAATASATIKDQEGESTVSSTKVSVSHDSRNDFFFPSEGTVARASAEYAGGELGGTTNYVKYDGSVLRFFPLPWEMALSVRGTLGHVLSFKGGEVPVYERYYLGGINSIRGFESRSIGPRDPVTDEIIGGTTKALLNVEYLFPLFPEQRVKGVVFFDTGNAYEGSIETGDLRSGAGAGLRWFSPIGPLRLEWGYNLDKRVGEKQALWEFTIGGYF